MTLSDQQLVTGIAILAASFKLLNEGTITAYHFTIARDLAFFSSNAHLLSLLALWNYWGSERKTSRLIGGNRRFPVPFVTKWRFFAMLVFLGLLIAATWHTAYGLWDEWASCPARCIPKGRSNMGGEPLGWAVASTYFMVVQYTSYAMAIGERILGRAKTLRNHTHKFDDAMTKRLKASPAALLMYKAVRGLAVLWRWFNFSEFIELLEMMAWFLANCYWVSQNRAAAEDVFGHSAQGRKERAREGEWGFGQIVPVLLLMLPVMVFSGTYHGRSSS